MDAEETPALNEAVNVALAVDVLARLNALSHENIEDGLRDLLESVGLRLRLDRVAFWDYDERHRRMERVSFWQAPGTDEALIPHTFTLEELTAAGLDMSQDVLAFDDIEADSARNPIRLLAPNDTGRAFLAGFPHRDSALSGALVFMMRDDPRSWTADDHAIIRLLVHAFDATALRVRAERRSERQQQHYRDFLDNSDSAIWCWRFEPPLDFEAPLHEVAARIVTAPYVESNEAHCRARGHGSPENVVGKTWLDLYANDDPQAFDRYLGFLRQYLRQEAYLYESRADGRIYKVQIYREVIDNLTHHIWGEMTDVTEVESSRRELAISEARLKDWIDHSDDMIACIEFPGELARSVMGGKGGAGPSRELAATRAPPFERAGGGTVVECTDTFAQAYGYPTRTGFVGQALDPTRSPFDREDEAKLAADFIRNGFTDVEGVLRRSMPGGVQWCHVRLQGVFREEGPLHVWMTAKNRTDEVLARRELEQSQDRIRLLMHDTAEARLCLMPAGLGDTPEHVRQALLDAPVVECSDMAARLAGFDDRSMVLRRSLAELGTAFRQRWFARLCKQLAPRKLSDFEYEMDVDGHRRTFRHSTELIEHPGEPPQIWLTGRDVTDEVRSREALQNSERLRKLAMSAAELHLWQVSTDAGLTLEPDPGIAGLESFLRDPEQLLEWTDPACRARLQHAAALFRSTPDTMLHEEFRFRPPNGDPVTFEVWGTALSRDDDGTLLRAAGVFRDVTEDRALERRMVNSQKLESLGVLAGGIAHDFNNLLTSIIGNAELGQMGLNQSTETAKSLREISLGANRAAELCRQLLAYAGEVSPQREDHNLVELVDEMAGLLRMSASKQCTIEVRQTNSQLGIHADASQISQLIINLIVNASDAIGDRPGTVAISAAKVDAVSAAEHPGPGPFALLEVRDDGVGMMPEVRERMFDPFFSTKFAGRGLGMAAVQGIIRAHDGSISVESEPGSGTTIRVLLPLKDLPDRVETPSRPARSSVGRRILIVDDEPDVLDVAVRMASRLGLITEAVSSGEDALRRLREIEGFDLILMDLSMPGMGGAAAARAALEMNPTTPILLSSGYSAEGLPEDLLRAGVGFLPKPYSLDAFQAALDQHIEPASTGQCS